MVYDFTHNILYLDIDGLVQERYNSIANALELQIFCTNPSTKGIVIGLVATYAKAMSIPVYMSVTKAMSLTKAIYVYACDV